MSLLLLLLIEIGGHLRRRAGSDRRLAEIFYVLSLSFGFDQILILMTAISYIALLVVCIDLITVLVINRASASFVPERADICIIGGDSSLGLFLGPLQATRSISSLNHE